MSVREQGENPSAESVAAGEAGKAPCPTSGLFGGLSGKLLWLTVFFIMLAEILIFVPSIASMRVRWLEDGESPDVQQWVAAQNAHTRATLDARPDRGWWHERLVALMQLPVVMAVQVRGDALFCLERPAGGADTNW